MFICPPPVQFPQFTDAEDDSGDDGDGVEYDFRWAMMSPRCCDIALVEIETSGRLISTKAALATFKVD